MTFAVPLCILNVDISAHISDDSGVFIQRPEGVGFLLSTPRQRMWFTQMILGRSDYGVSACACARVGVNILSAGSHGAAWPERATAALRVHISSGKTSDSSTFRSVQLECLSLKISIKLMFSRTLNVVEKQETDSVDGSGSLIGCFLKIFLASFPLTWENKEKKVFFAWRSLAVGCSTLVFPQ